jgi:antirestriction protein
MGNDETPRAWVGCLACYNGGELVGAWVDGTDAEEYVPAGHYIRCLRCGAGEQILELSGCAADVVNGDEQRGHYRGITGPDGSPHEEQWVMDFEGYAGLLKGECSPSEASKLARAIEDIRADSHPVEAVAAWLANTGETLEEWDGPTREAFEEAYAGEHESGAAFAEDHAVETGAVPEEREWPLTEIDWEDAWCELEFGGCWAISAPGGGVYVFNS